MSDGKVTIETALDSAGFEKGLSLIKGAIAALGLGALAKDIVDTGSAFDTAMSQVQATMGITKDSMSELDGQTVNTMDSLTDLAIKMGSDTAFSATECSEALNYLALAGYDTQEMADTLPTVLNLAAAGGMELATASDMVTDAMSALGLSTDQADMMVDQMAKTASSSNTSVSQLGEALLTLGATGKTVAGGTVELDTALGLLADNGMKGSVGGTHLRNILLSLQTPTDQAADALENLGVQIFDAEGNMRPLNDVLGDLNASMDGMTTAEKQNIISTIFNKTDIAAAQTLLDNCGDSWDELAASIENSGGAAAQMAETQLDNLEGQVTKMNSALDAFKLAIWNDMRDPLQGLAKIATDSITELTAAFQEGGISELASCAMEMMLDFANQLIAGIPNVFNAGTQAVIGFLNGLQSYMPQLTSTAGSAISQLVSGITANGPQLITAAANTFTSFVQGLAAQLPTLIPQAVQMVLTLASSLVSNIPTIVQAGVSLIGGLVQGIVNSIPEIITQAPKIINDFWDAFDSAAISLLTAGANAIITLGKGIIDNLPLIIANAGEIAKAIFNTLMHLDMINAGKTLIKNLGEGAKALGPTLKQKFLDLGKNAMNAIKNIDWAGVGKAVINFLKNGASAMSSLFSGGLKTIGTTALNAFKAINWAAVGKAVLQLVINGLKALGSTLVSALKTIGTNALNGFKAINWGSIGRAAVQGIVAGVTGAASSLVSKMKSLASSALSAAKNALGIHSPSKAFEQEVGRYIPEGAAVGVEKGTGELTDSIEDMADQSLDAAGGMSEALTDAITPDVTGLAGYIAALKGMLYTTQSDMPTINAAQKGVDLSYKVETGSLAESMESMIAYMESMKEEIGDMADRTVKAINNMDVTIDKKKAGKILAPTISDELGLGIT